MSEYAVIQKSISNQPNLTYSITWEFTNSGIDYLGFEEDSFSVLQREELNSHDAKYYQNANEFVKDFKEKP